MFASVRRNQRTGTNLTPASLFPRPTSLTITRALSALYALQPNEEYLAQHEPSNHELRKDVLSWYAGSWGWVIPI